MKSAGFAERPLLCRKAINLAPALPVLPLVRGTHGLFACIAPRENKVFLRRNLFSRDDGLASALASV